MKANSTIRQNTETLKDENNNEGQPRCSRKVSSFCFLQDTPEAVIGRDRMVVGFTTSQWLYAGTQISFTNKADLHDITELLLNVVLNTITKTLTRHLSVWPRGVKHYKQNPYKTPVGMAYADWC